MKTSESQSNIQVVAGNSIQITHKILIEFKIQDKKFKQQFIIPNNSISQIILGMDFISSNRIILNTNTRKIIFNNRTVNPPYGIPSMKNSNLNLPIKGASYIKGHQNKSKFDPANITTITNTMSTEEQMVRISATETEIHVLWNEYEDLLENRKINFKKEHLDYA